MKEKYILYLYSAAAFRQVVLPAVNNTKYVIKLSAGRFLFLEEVILNLEVIEHVWYLDWEEERRLLCGNHFMKLRVQGEAIVSLIIQTELSAFYAGRKYELPGTRPISIGSAAGNSIRYNAFQLVSAHHAVIYKHEEGYYIADQSKNGVYINGRRLEEQKQLCFGDFIDLFGLRIVFLSETVVVYGRMEEGQAEVSLHLCMPKVIPNPVTYSPERSFFHRSPNQWRELGAEESEIEEIEIEAPASKHEPEKQPLLLTLGPAFTFMLPMVLSQAVSTRQGYGENSYLYISLVTSAGTALMGMLWAFSGWFYHRRNKKWEEKRRRVVYKNYLWEAEQYIAGRHQTERELLLDRYPCLSDMDVTVEMEAVEARLWSRNEEQEDFLYQRIGLGQIPMSMVIRVPRPSLTMFRDDLREAPGQLKRTYEWLREVPISVNLAQHRMIGLTGGQAAVEMAAGLMMQIAINNCYTDVKIAFLYNEDDTEMSELAGIVKWLPHIWSENKSIRYLAGSRSEAGEVLYALGEILRNPMRKHYVVFIADIEMLEGESAARFIFSGAEGMRLTAVFVGEGIEDMPNDCRYFLRNDSYFSGIWSGGEEKRVEFDRISMAHAEKTARKLFGIRVRESMVDESLADHLSFLSLFEGRAPEDMDIAGNWRRSRIHETIRVPIGRRAGNRILYLDAHEKYHGPHGLIAGTTGSGKSELVQTYLLSLAVHFSPEDVSFFIIDFKGGGMGNLLAHLPHTAGTVSNLSGHQIRRALISIKSENERRQRQFQMYGINHIDQYTVAYKKGEAKDCIPHLFIVIDEFAELKREEPECMKELVSVAQVGRSLGVHLLLATQKPAGVVDDHIWSNTRFRMCLRVQDRQDSMDMLHKPDAASLTGAGRCYLQVGNDEVFELFQAAYSGAIYKINRKGEERASRMLTGTGKPVLTVRHGKLREMLPENRTDGMEENISEAEIGNGIKKAGMTQLEKMTEYLHRLGEKMGYIKKMKIWMPLLPVRLDLLELERFTDIGGEPESALHFLALAGLCDHPARQNQYPLCLDLCSRGNVLICGGPGVGKSTLLQTLIYSLMTSYPPVLMEFYLIDCGSGMLRSFWEMPHVAGRAGEEPERWERIIYRLKQELKQRKVLFSGGSFIHMKEGERIPGVILAIDHYEGFRAQTEEKYDEFLLRLSAEGKNTGIYLMVTASSIGMGGVPGKLASNFGCRLCLEMGDTYQYGELLGTGSLQVFPERGVKGRGIARIEDDILEFQTALVFGEDNDFYRMNLIMKKAEEIKEMYAPYKAKLIPEIPAIPEFHAFCGEVLHKNYLSSGQKIPIGYEQESGALYEIDLNDIYCFLISGRKGSGKTNLLTVIGRMTLFMEADVIWIDFSGKCMEKYFFGTGPGVEVRSENRESMKRSQFPGTDINDEAKGRQIKRIQTDEELYQWLYELYSLLLPGDMQAFEEKRMAGNLPDGAQIVVLIDDLADFYHHILHPREKAESVEAFVEHIWQKKGGCGLYWFAAWNPETDIGLSGFPICQIFTGYGKGLHLGGNVIMQRNFSFDDLSYREQSKILKPGIALIPPAEQMGTVKVILPHIKPQTTISGNESTNYVL